MHGSRYLRLLVMASIAAVVWSSAATALPADVDGSAATGHSVSQTFNNAPFAYRMELRRETGAYRIYRLRYPSPVLTPVKQNNTIPADYYFPRSIEPGDPRRPAVICLHILDGNFELVEMLCSALASRGIPAVMFKLPYYGERSLPGGPRAMLNKPELFLAALSQAGQDVRRTVDLLASRAEVNPRQIGVAGISLGGLVAATAACKEKRLHRAALILAGGDLEWIINHTREAQAVRQFIQRLPPQQQARFRQTIRSVDPLGHAAGLRDRAQRGRVLMINGTEDRVIPRPCAQKLAAALGMPEKVVWLDGLGHYTAMAVLPRIMQTTVEFFAVDLPPGVMPASPIPSEHGPVQIVALLLQQTNTLLAAQPKQGRCHFADLEVSATSKEGQTIEGRLRLVRGPNNRFKLVLKLKGPIAADVALGQGSYPWLASGGKIVFKGTNHPADPPADPPSDPPADPLAMADRQHLMKLRMAAGALAGVAIAPNLLERLVSIDDDTPPGGPPAVRITLKDKSRGSLRLVLTDDKRAPRELTFDLDGSKGTVMFHAWQPGAIVHKALFDPPSDLPGKNVDQADIYRIFSAVFNFAMEKAQ